MNTRSDALKHAIVGTLGRWTLNALMATVRFEVRDDVGYRGLQASGSPVVYTLWHGRLLPLTWYHRARGIGALISLSKDGEYIARVVQGWGYRVVRGSTSRGGSRALAEMIRLGRKGRSLAFTPDGPRGPRERMKPGVLLAAQRSGLPIVPLSGACDRAWWFEGWDRFLVPKPFSRVVLSHGMPVHVPPELDEAGLARLSASIETTLRELQSKLDAEIGGEASSTATDAAVSPPQRGGDAP